jgi:hypothetical protein
MTKDNNSEKPSVESIIRPKTFPLKFEISALLENGPILGVTLIWPDGDLEMFRYRLGRGSQNYISLPLPMSTLTDDSILQYAEKMASQDIIVKHCRVDGSTIYLESLEKRAFWYKTEDLKSLASLSDEEAVIYLFAVRHYFWAFSAFLRIESWTPEELEKFISAYPETKGFRRIAEMASSYFFEGKGAKPKRGHRSRKTKKEKQTKDYALYNLVNHIAKHKGSVESALDDLAASIMNDLELDSDYYDALRKAYYRAKKVIESPPPKLTSYMAIQKARPRDPELICNAYILLCVPSLD